MYIYLIAYGKSEVPINATGNLRLGLVKSFVIPEGHATVLACEELLSREVWVKWNGWPWWIDLVHCLSNIISDFFERLQWVLKDDDERCGKSVAQADDAAPRVTTVQKIASAADSHLHVEINWKIGCDKQNGAEWLWLLVEES